MPILQNPSQPLRLLERSGPRRKYLNTPRCDAPGQAVTPASHRCPRTKGVAVAVPGSHRSAVNLVLMSGLAFTLLCFFASGSCTRGSPWPPLTVQSQNAQKSHHSRPQGIVSSHPALLPCVVFQENQPRLSSKPRSRNWVFCYLEQSRAVGTEFTGPRWRELKQVGTTVGSAKAGLSISVGTLLAG